MMENSSTHYEGSDERSKRRSAEQNQRTQESLESERRANFAAMGMLAERTLIERTAPVESRTFEPKRFERLAAQVLGKEALSPEEEAVPEIMYERRHEIKDEATTPQTTASYIEPDLVQDNPEPPTPTEDAQPVNTASVAADSGDDQPITSPTAYSGAVRRGFYTGVAVVAVSIMVYLIAQMVE